MIKASLIISVYKNTAFLKAVLDSLCFQSEKQFEIIITEDGNDPEMRKFISHYPFCQPFRHLTQEDIGWRKNRALNNAIRESSSPWLIFIDGDCVLHPRFIEMHVRHANPNHILAGKRIKLDAALSDFLIEKQENVFKIQSILLRNLFLRKHKTGFPEEGIFIAPDSLFGIIPRLRKLNHLKGCNMSFSKEAIHKINGFDEDYIQAAVGEDADLSWRFEAAGYKHKSLRNLAVQYHLHHPENWHDQSANLEKMNNNKTRNAYVCVNGLTKF